MKLLQDSSVVALFGPFLPFIQPAGKSSGNACSATLVLFASVINQNYKIFNIALPYPFIHSHPYQIYVQLKKKKIRSIGKKRTKSLFLVAHSIRAMRSAVFFF